MSQCDERIKELLPLYLDNELNKEEQELVESHIFTCSECREELELYKLIHNELDLDDIPLPNSFHEDMMKRIHDESKIDRVVDREPTVVKIKKNKKKNFYSRYKKQMNIAAMLVFVILLSVIGLTSGDKWNDFGSSSDTTTSDSAMEDSYSKDSSDDRENYSESKEDSSSEESMEMATSMEENAVEEDYTSSDNEQVMSDEDIDNKASDSDDMVDLEESKDYSQADTDGARGDVLDEADNSDVAQDDTLVESDALETESDGLEMSQDEPENTQEVASSGIDDEAAADKEAEVESDLTSEKLIKDTDSDEKAKEVQDDVKSESRETQEYGDIEVEPENTSLFVKVILFILAFSSGYVGSKLYKKFKNNKSR